MAWARKTKIILIVILVVGGVVGTAVILELLLQPQISILESSLVLVDCRAGINDQFVILNLLLGNSGVVRGFAGVMLLVDGVGYTAFDFILEPGEEKGFVNLDVPLRGCDAQNVSVNLDRVGRA